MKPPSVFIIASNADYAPAWRIQQQLSKGRVDCFFCDEALLRVGEKGYRARAEHALDTAARLVVVAGSRARVESEWVRHMWRRYLERTSGENRPVMTVCCDGMTADDLPRTLRRGENLTFPDGLARLPGWLAHSGKNRPAGPTGPVPASAPGSRRTMRILTAVTALNVLILGTVVWLVTQRGGPLLTGAEARTAGGGAGVAMTSTGKPANGPAAGRSDPGNSPDKTGAVKKVAGPAAAGAVTELTDDNDDESKPGPGSLMPVPGTRAAKNVMDTPVAGTPLYVPLGEGRLAFVFIPPGSFVMGSPEDEVRRDTDEPRVKVEITRGFWLARTECTQALWKAVMGSAPSRFEGHPELPVESVSWHDLANSGESFLARMNQRRQLPPGWQYALPTEAQWEYACRAGTTTPFSFGSTLNGTLANCDGLLPYGTKEPGPYVNRTTRAGSYPPNPWGLYDMHGNVAEICADTYIKQPPGGPDPLVKNGTGRVLRGGSWSHHGWGCRSAARESISENLATDHTQGFRLAIVPTG